MSDKPTKPITTPQRAPSMAIAFRAAGRTLRHGYDNLGTLMISGLLWLVSAIIFLPLTVLLVLLVESVVGARHYELLLLPLGPTTAALHRVARPMTEERSTTWRAFFGHLRADLGWSTRLLAVLVLGFFTIQINIGFYSTSTATPLRFLSIFFLTLLILWAGVALYAFPMALRQQQQRVRTTLRNTTLLVLANTPGVLISLILVLAFSLLLLALPPLFVLVPAVITLWGQENVRLLLVASGYLPKDEIADRERIRR